MCITYEKIAFLGRSRSENGMLLDILNFHQAIQVQVEKRKA